MSNPSQISGIKQAVLDHKLSNETIQNFSSVCQGYVETCFKRNSKINNENFVFTPSQIYQMNMKNFLVRLEI